jgi:stage V sporulation protein B
MKQEEALAGPIASTDDIGGAPATEDAANANAGVRTAGRGGLAVLGAKVYFIVVSFLQQVLLAKVIGDAGWGALSRVLPSANILNNVMIAGSVQGVSRSVARAGDPEEEQRAFRSTLRVHVPIAIAMALGFIAFAPVIAWFQHAPYITTPLMVLAGVVFLYGVYGPLVGKLNGTGQFGKQALLDVLFATIRTVGMLALGWIFMHAGSADGDAAGSVGARGALGACVGFVAAAACIVPLALMWTGTGKAGASRTVPRAGTYLAQLGPLVLAQLFTNLLLQVDITLLARFVSLSATASAAAGGLAADATKRADEWLAVYRACQLFAFLPYQLLMSITQVLFPLLARARAADDTVAVRAYVRRGVRLGTIACGLLVMVIATLPGSLLHFAFAPEYAVRGASTLRILALGQGVFALLGIAVTVLASLGRERLAVAVTAFALALVAALCWVTVPAATFGGAQLEASATATSIALVVGLITAGFLVRRLTGAFGPAATFLRVGGVLAIGTFVGTRLPVFGKLVTPVMALAVAVTYLVLLVVTGELGKEDLGLVKAVLLRKKG